MRVKKLFQLYFVALSIVGQNAPAAEIQVYDASQNKTKTVDLADLSQKTFEFETDDPNFPEKKGVRYGGLTTLDVIERAFGSIKIVDVAIVGKDDYTCSWNGADFTKDQPILTTSENGKSIDVRSGGPIKVMFRQKMPMAAYCWYATTIVINSSPTPSLRLYSDGKAIDLSIADLEKAKVARYDLSPSPVRGYRNRDLCCKNMRDFTFVSLKKLLSSLHTKIPKNVELSTFSGSIKSYNLTENNADVILLVPKEKSLFSYPVGGPFMATPIKPETNKTKAAKDELVYFVKELRLI